MKQKLTKQEVAEAKKLAKSFGQMKKKFSKALIDDMLKDKTNQINKNLN